MQQGKQGGLSRLNNDFVNPGSRFGGESREWRWIIYFRRIQRNSYEKETSVHLEEGRTSQKLSRVYRS